MMPRPSLSHISFGEIGLSALAALGPLNWDFFRGINLYAMLTGQLPFHVEPINIAALHEKIMKGAKIPSHFSKGS